MSTLNSRELIIERAAKNKPGQSALPDISLFEKNDKGALDDFLASLKNIGGEVHFIHDMKELIPLVIEKYKKHGRIYSAIQEFQKLLNQKKDNLNDSHSLENVEVAIIGAHFGIAENGAVWVTDDLMANRVLPFICQHLVVLISEKDILPTMHEAYLHSAVQNYNYGVFIAGPSKQLI